ncbi:LPS export ABC transporter permease LptF [candidate division KSB3 bacterium]|uniref:LPS export ABC transporter permease LptF n=1 Tax=candidate division KSB3 bacterium TaxID=2044937 RepID=A0A2G6E3L5_9BACT|nr:MAG: LPS export ABC transporter permease LptF [candidate division KSB3 bacterium]PIE29136.1 MAG: LPS export ABC transporter permease LptF [candidate division KSB3 bacterium]
MGLRYKTINSYLLKELFGPFLLGLLVFTFVLLMQQVLELIELVISKGVSVKLVLELVLYIMPSFLVLTIPMAVLVAALTAFGRLSTDSEVTALKASGVSLYSLFVPVLIFSILMTSLTFFLYAVALPWGNHQFRVALYELARTKASIGLKEHVFNNTFPNLAIYVDDISERDESFSGIMISDSRDPNNPQTIFARRGRLISDGKALRVVLRLEECASHPKTIRNPLKYQVVSSPVLDILLSFQAPEDNQSLRLSRTDRDMTISQLTQQYLLLKEQDRHQEPNRPNPAPQMFSESITWREAVVGMWKVLPQLAWDSFVLPGGLSSPYLVEIHKRFSIPFACIVFGLIGTPLGIQSRRAGKSGGFAVSVVLLLIYYIFITAGESLGDDGSLPIILAVWTPNVLLGVTGLILLVRTARR